MLSRERIEGDFHNWEVDCQMDIVPLGHELRKLPIHEFELDLDPPFTVARYPHSHAAADSGVVLSIKKDTGSQGRLGNVHPCFSPRPPPRIPFTTSHREGEPAPDREINFILGDPMVRVIDFGQNAEISDSTSVPRSVPSSSRVSR